MLKSTIRRLLVAGAVATISSQAGVAHEVKSLHGGRVADAAQHHLELVVTNDTVQVFVSDKASQPVAATGLTGLAIVVTPAGSTRIPLAASDPSRLSGKADTALPNDAKSVVQVRLADGQTIQARFD